MQGETSTNLKLDVIRRHGGPAPATDFLYDESRSRLVGAMVNGVWSQVTPGGLWTLGFNDNSYVDLGMTRATDFTVESFSILMWIWNNGADADYLLNQGVVDVDGWCLYIWNPGGAATIAFRTNQGGAHTDVSAVASVPLTTWTHLGFTRSGATGQFYVNGQPFVTGGALADAVATAGGNNLLMGINNNLLTNGFIGKLAYMKIKKELLLPGYIRNIAESERRYFGVQ
jgi:hypothetical protein